RKRRRRAPRRDARADGAGAASLLALLFAGVASLAAPAYAQPELEPAGVRVHAPLQLEGEASREAGDPEAATICPDCGMRECTMDHQAAERGAASAPAEGVVCEHCDMVNCTMEHLETEAGAVMVMGGIPLWLFLVGVGGLILFSFVAVEVVGPSAKPGFRRNLIKNRRLYAIVRSRWFQVVPQLVMILILGALIYAGLVGNQVANITPVLVWTIWWGVLIFAVLVMASAWCFVCPWDGLANLVSRLRLAARIESLSIGAKFPLWLANVYPAIALFVVLTWLELGYGVTTQAQATAYMGLGMIAMAIGGALLWDGKRFCAHFCPVGRICGIYSNFAPIEIRAHKSKACRTCTTEDCLHGNERGYPCPTGISLKVVQDATMCTMCTECIKSCDRQNVAINLRPFGADLSKGIAPKTDEAWLALMLLALTLFHGLSMTPAWESFDPGGMSILKWLGTRFGLGHGPSFSIAMLVAVAIPIGVYWLSCTLAAAWAKEGIGPKRVFVTYAFSLLPVALFYHLAHNLMHVLGEGGAVVPMLSDPLGTGADYLGTRGVHLGHLIDEQTMWALQVGLILIGHVFGVIFAHRFAHRLYEDRKAAIRSLIPMTVMMIAISVAGLYLMHMDMNMRVGRM
ncbi:MAG: hypothetical protein OEY14_14265, partial [Myxococcales bacterium]|nr:hypothetical protein [Myxococcales bacterium]